MRIFVSPISGGFFPYQLAMMKMFPKPDLMLGASGGNLANYLYTCDVENGNAVTTLIERVDARKNNIKTIDGIVSVSGRTEKITLLHDKTTNKAIIFTNKYQGESYLAKLRIYDESKELYGMEIRYGKENVERVTKAIIASAAIPDILPDVVVEDHENRSLYHHFDDGGVCYPSPLTPLCFSLGILAPRQIFYFCPFDLDLVDSIIEGAPDPLKKSVIRSVYSMRAERALSLIHLIPYGKVYHTRCPFDDFKYYAHTRCYVVVQPKGVVKPINIFSFTGEDVETIGKSIEIECLIWYVQ